MITYISDDQNTIVNDGKVFDAIDATYHCRGCHFHESRGFRCPRIPMSEYKYAYPCVNRNDGVNKIWVRRQVQKTVDNKTSSEDNSSMNSNTTTHKTAGYTYKLEWKEFHKWLGMDVNKSFYTTDDAIHIHLAAFAKQGIVPTVTKL